MMIMRSVLLLTGLLLACGAQAGPVYKCTAENGKVIYSGKPCPNTKAEKLDIENRPTDEAAVKERVAVRKERVESIKESKQEAADAKTEAHKKKEERKLACEKARETLQRTMRARRLYKGEGENRAYLSSDEIDAQRQTVQDKVKELCGGQ